MKRTIVWSDRALRCLESAVDHLAQRNPVAAGALVDAIENSVARLARRNTGRPGRVPGTFEQSLPKFRYIIAFAIDADTDGGERLTILLVVHTARHWPPGTWPKD